MSINGPSAVGAPLTTNQAFLRNMKKVMPPAILSRQPQHLDDEEKQIYVQAQGFSQLHKDLVQLSNQIAPQNRDAVSTSAHPPG